MRFRVIEPAMVEPITLEAARLHLRLDLDYDPEVPANPEDALVASLITAARQWCETFIGQALAPQTIEAAADAFGAELALPLGPVIEVTEVAYIDANGATTELPSSDYSFDAFTGCLGLAYGAAWPSTRAHTNAVVVRYRAGYTAAQIPQPIVQAMLLLVGHWFANREESVVGVSITEAPMASKALLQPYRCALGV